MKQLMKVLNPERDLRRVDDMNPYSLDSAMVRLHNLGKYKASLAYQELDVRGGTSKIRKGDEYHIITTENGDKIEEWLSCHKLDYELFTEVGWLSFIERMITKMITPDYYAKFWGGTKYIVDGLTIYEYNPWW